MICNYAIEPEGGHNRPSDSTSYKHPFGLIEIMLVTFYAPRHFITTDTKPFRASFGAPIRALFLDRRAHAGKLLLLRVHMRVHMPRPRPMSMPMPWPRAHAHAHAHAHARAQGHAQARSHFPARGSPCRSACRDPHTHMHAAPNY